VRRQQAAHVVLRPTELNAVQIGQIQPLQPELFPEGPRDGQRLRIGCQPAFDVSVLLAPTGHAAHHDSPHKINDRNDFQRKHPEFEQTCCLPPALRPGIVVRPEWTQVMLRHGKLRPRRLE